MDLNEYIIENAARGGDDSFIRDFHKSEIFFAIDSIPEGLPGNRILQSDMDIKLETATLPVGRMGLFYATKGDARLGQAYAGLPLLQAVDMIVDDMPDLDGMLIQSSGDAWFAIPKQTLRTVRGQIRRPAAADPE